MQITKIEQKTTLAADVRKQTINSSTSFNQQQTETVIKNRRLLAHEQEEGGSVRKRFVLLLKC